MKKTFISLCIVLLGLSTNAQLDLEYQIPPKEIMELADIKLPPVVSMTEDANYAVLRYRNQYKSIEELSETELRLGGLRINPLTNISSREIYYSDIAILDVKNGKENYVNGLPENPRLSNFIWSPNQKMMAFTNTTKKGVELWILDIAKAEIKKITEDKINANIGTPFEWLQDNKSLLVKFLPEDKKALINESEAIPTGPTVSINEGQKAQNRTYQDLLKNKNDEFNFEQLVRSVIYKVDLNGTKKIWKDVDMYSGLNFSPNGEYILVTTIERPFSYIVPYFRFPTKTIIYDKEGKEIKKILEVPLIEELPQGFMAERKGMRDLNWRSDKPATLYWAEVLDEGDPEVEVEFRDEVFTLDAPFNGKKKSILKTINRFAYISWGNDELALAIDYWWNTRNMKTYMFNPSNAKQEVITISDRNYQDRYNDPGSFVTKRNKFGKYTLEIDGDYMYLLGDGYSAEGIRPFVDKFNIKNKNTERVWRADGKETLESIIDFQDTKSGLLLTKIESL